MVPLQPIARPLESATPLQPTTSQPIASPISVKQTVNPSSPMLKTSPRTTRTIRLPKRFDDYELSRHDWTLLLAEGLTAVPCLSYYGTELNFFIHY